MGRAARTKAVGKMEAGWVMALLALSWGGTLSGQTAVTATQQPQQQGPAVDTPIRGFHFDGLSTSASYWNVNFPGYTTGTNNDLSYNASATAGWAKPGPGSNLGVTYTASYFGSARYTDANSLNHSVTINANTPRKLSPRWTLDFGVGANMYNFRGYLFSPVNLGSVSSSQSSFDDLAGAVTGKSIASDSLAATLNGAKPLDSAARILYGTRTLSVTAQSTVTYAHSNRLSFNVGVNGTRNQAINTRSRDAGDVQLGAVVPYTTSGSLIANVAYSLSSRTTTGAYAVTTRAFTTVQDAYFTNTGVFLGRVLNRNWFVNVDFGTGTLIPVKEAYQVKRGLQYTAGGSVGFKSRTHVVLARVDRRAGDPYAVGSYASTQITGAWTWSLPGRSWSVNAGGGQDRQDGLNGLGFRGWRGYAGLTQALGGGFSLFSSYAYLNFNGSFGLFPAPFTGHSIQIGVHWTPNVLARR